MKKGFVVLGISVFILVAGCASPHIGTRVHSGNPMLCQLFDFPFDLPAECKITTKHLLLEYTISKNEPDEYIIQGKAKHIGPSFWGTIEGWFFLHLIQGGVLVETLPFSMGLGNPEEPIDFKYKFSTSNAIDAVILSYKFEMTDSSVY